MNLNNIQVIIYERKSTDREDMQQASLPAQNKHNQQTITRHNLKTLKTISESASAKLHWTRKGFNEMITLIESGKVQAMVVDEPTRISRSTLDAALIVHLMETGKLKYVFTNSMVFAWDSIMEVKLLEDMMQWAKVDNKMKAKATKDKMLFIAENKQKLLTKAPFGYQNFRQWKAPTDVRPHPENQIIWKEMLKLLGTWLPYREVAEVLFETRWLATKYNNPVSKEQVKRWLFHKFHDGLYDFAGRTFKHNHRLIVSSKYVNEIRAKREHKTFQKTCEDIFPLKWFLKAYWDDKMTLSGYQKKWHIYYKSAPKYSNQGINVNINQEIILESFWKTLDNYVITDTRLKTTVIGMMKEYFSSMQKDANDNAQQLRTKLAVVQNKQANLLDLLCEEKISQQDFDNQRKKYLDESIQYDNLLEWILYISDDILKSALKCIELLNNLTTVWKNADTDKKVEIIKMICVELYVDTKKQLYIQENELFELIKILNFSNGVTKPLRCWTKKLIEFLVYENQRFTELYKIIKKCLN